MTHVVIVGAGFAGLYCAKSLARDRRFRITIVDRTNHHLFQPLLYQVAMAELNPSDISAPIRMIFRRRRNVEVRLATVSDILPDRRSVVTTAGEIPYDALVLATGARHAYFGNDRWEIDAPGLKTLEQATEIRRRVLESYEAAENDSDPVEQSALLTFVVVGGGPTGVELAGAIGEMGHFTLARDFRRIDPHRTRVLLVEAGPRILPTFPADLSARAARDLATLGVEVRTGTPVTEVSADSVAVGDERIATRTVLWAAGVAPSELGKSLGAPTDRAGRVRVEPDLTVPRFPEIFVAGDLAHCRDRSGEPLPGIAPVALQQGRYIARVLKRRAAGKTTAAFRYVDYGIMATIGHNKAVARLGPFKLTGYVAWLAWVFLHIWRLMGFRNRVLVMIQWAWVYFTHRRGARLILGKNWRFY